MSSSRKLPAVAAGLTLLGSGLMVGAPSPAAADPLGNGLVVNEVYGGGGNSGATYTHDFIELYNPTSAAIDVSNMSVQYRSASGSGTGFTNLVGSVPAGAHYLIQEAKGSGGTTPLPTPQATGTLAMSGSSGSVALVNGTGSVVPTAANTVDLVGYGDATLKEGSAAPLLSNTTAATRDAAGHDTDDNATDFEATEPTPGAPFEPDTQPPVVTVATIPEIQGSGPASAMDGEMVSTRGVVTAAYPSGGFFGFYMQTPGSGGTVDLDTHQASDGLFVYYPFGSGAVDVLPGDHVEVTGEVDEYAGLTQLRIADAGTDVVALEPAAAPLPVTGVWPGTDVERESLEGMLFSAEGDFTVSDTYSTNTFGEVGLAKGDRPLITPTQVADAQDETAIAAVEADNEARGIILDDGSSTNFASSNRDNNYTPNRGDLTPPYVSNAEPVRVGATATFTEAVILSQGGNPGSPTYRFQPTRTVVGPENAQSPATFENTRTAAPDEARIDADGTSDLRVASFNVLNYFTTLGDSDDDNVGDNGCLPYNDADGDGNNVRDGCDARGAWDPQDLARQQEKIVSAINALEADVVGLMEIENSAVVDGAANADEATRTLVAALNAAAGGEVWAANPSSADLPPLSEMDVISNAIIYRIGSVERLGDARALGDQSSEGEAFDNAREPIAQAFAPKGGGEPFLVVVNHFKSKGSGTDDGTGQGNANPDRVAQAEALRDWVPTVQQDLGVEPTLLIGDFNSYAMEDPLQVLYTAGYSNVEQVSGNEEYSYTFGGMVGSLDHVLANPAAMEEVTGVDVWNINSGESLAFEYSRWNNHATDFHQPTPYRSSDHDPVIVGLDLTDEPDGRVESEVSVRSTPGKVTAGKTRVHLHVAVDAEGSVPTGSVTVVVEDQVLTGQLRDGRVVLRLAPFDAPGVKTVEVAYGGDDQVRGDTETTEITVVEKKKKGKN